MSSPAEGFSPESTPRVSLEVGAKARFHIRTFGCQMNQHDAQKMANLLHHAGLEPSDRAEAADVVVIHTCSIREKAEHRLYTELGILLARKRAEPQLVVGVGGCVAQQEGDGDGRTRLELHAACGAVELGIYCHADRPDLLPA